jgi:ABC-type antimicrobial peptide transport system, ATPase component
MADIICSNLYKSYGSNNVFGGFSHTFIGGSVNVITGPSGRGKTTLLRLIAGFELPDSGTITGGGLHSCAFSFSDDRLFEDFSALENVACAITSSSKKDRNAAARGLLLSLGLDAESLTAPVKTYSGGMKRRVTLARAFGANRSILLLDEPTAGLDSDTRELALEFIRAHKKDATLIAVTHSTSVIDALGGSLLEL